MKMSLQLLTSPRIVCRHSRSDVFPEQVRAKGCAHAGDTISRGKSLKCYTTSFYNVLFCRISVRARGRWDTSNFIFFVNQCPGRGLGGDFAQVPGQTVCHMQKLFMMIEILIPICKHAAREMEV